jgi:hypothetical protein
VRTRGGAWQPYRFWSRIRLGAIFGGVPLVGASLALVELYGIDWPFVLTGPPVVLLLAASHGIVSYWPCPECKHRFFSHDDFPNPFARRCGHCELPKWHEPEGTSASTDPDTERPTTF